MSRYRPWNRILKWIINSGPDDPVFNLWLILGPFLIVLVAVVGRTGVTTCLGMAYILGFLVYTTYNGLTTAGRSNWLRHFK